MSRIRDLHETWMKEPDYQEAYDALEEEFSVAAALIRARADAGLTQEQLAERMGTKQAVVARWEGGEGAAINTDVGTARKGDWDDAPNQLCAIRRGRKGRTLR